MGVVFKGGTSGSRSADYNPPVPSSGTPQPVLRTESYGNEPASVVLNTNHSRAYHTVMEKMEDFIPNDLPISGSVPESSSDVCQCDVDSLGPTSGDHSVFKGAPNTGTKGGPA